MRARIGFNAPRFRRFSPQEEECECRARELPDLGCERALCALCARSRSMHRGISGVVVSY